MNRIRPINAVELILLSAGLISSAFGLSQTISEIDLWTLLIFAFLGLFWGIFSGGTRQSFSTHIIVSLLFSVIILTLTLQNAWLPLIRMWVELSEWLQRLVQGPIFAIPNAQTLVIAGQTLVHSTAPLFSRFAIWTSRLINGSPVYDPLVIVWIWTLLFTWICIWAGWSSRRQKNSFLWLLPALLLTAGLSGYAQKSIAPLLLLLATLLPLTIYVSHLNRERRWTAAHIDFSTEVRLDIALTSGFCVVILLVAAALAPSFSYQEIARWWEKITQPAASPGAAEAAQSFGLQAPTRIAPLASYQSPGLPQEHLIGAGPELSKQIVFTVAADDAPFAPWLGETRPLPRHYWRTRTYDFYTGHGWSTTATHTMDYAARSPLNETSTTTDQKLTIRLHGTSETIGGLFIFTGIPLNADTDVSFAFRSNADLFGGLAVNKDYTLQVALPIHTQTQLTGTQQSPPAWINTRYLRLPDNLPRRVTRLAHQITASEVSPYDQALAIETYLRQFPYTLDLPEPPSRQDVVDYFLFTQKQGYCDYYATAMIVLARASGLPARLVTGYASGRYDSLTGRWIVTEADAHSWAEIYLPDAGWVEFEPTPARRRLNPLETDASQGAVTISLNPAPSPSTEHQYPDWARTGLVILAAVVLLILSWLVRQGIRQFIFYRLPPRQAARWLFRELQRGGILFGIHPYPSQTLLEWMDGFQNRLQDVLHEDLSISLHRDLELIQNFYHRAVYSSHAPAPIQQHLVWGANRRISRRLRWIYIQSNVQKLHWTYNVNWRNGYDQKMD